MTNAQAHTTRTHYRFKTMKDSPPPIDPPEVNKAAGAGCMARIVRQSLQNWIDNEMGDECLWESWPECPTEIELTPNMILAALNSMTKDVVQIQPNQTARVDDCGSEFSQDGYALVENRTAALPITLGFEITVWEAERSLKELRSKVGAEFYQEIHIVRATLKFSLPNA
jgi:hypothetical protein